MRFRERMPLVLGLMVLAPYCAESLSGYDDTTGNPAALVFGLMIFAPLYGAPAVLIRETARRFGVRWPGILALAAAFGVIQAGIIDQSMFSDSYRAIDYWDEMAEPTFIAPIGLSANLAVTFVLTHTVLSFGAPIAVVESLRPDLSRRPWLRLPGTAVLVLLYLGAAAVVLAWHLDGETDHASAGQLAGASGVAALLALYAFTLGRRRRKRTDGAVPRPAVVLAGSLVAFGATGMLPYTWAGVAGTTALCVGACVVVGRLARSRRWHPGHIAAVAAGPLVATAVMAFWTVPLGDIPDGAKYGHNVVFLAGALLLAAWAMRRGRREVQTDG